METIFVIAVLLNIPIALAAFISSFILLRRAKNNQIYFNFGLANLFLALWATDIILLFSFPKFGMIFGNLSWFLGIWILHYFLIFTYYFPTPLKTKIYFDKTVLYFLTLLLSFSIFIPGFYTLDVHSVFPYIYFQVNTVGMLIFSGYFVLLAILAFKNLFFQYRRSDGIFKIQLKKIMSAVALAVLFNLIFSVNFYYFTKFDLTPIGILFTSGILFYIYLILFYV
ncbi:MAG: hypothetical protein RBS77_05415 [Candidatus Moranbacteria bacterium]|jgi:hypothetical protein|nr:hypothetical protein [Candidatus Moranbacteria bacterium]